LPGFPAEEATAVISVDTIGKVAADQRSRAALIDPAGSVTWAEFQAATAAARNWLSTVLARPCSGDSGSGDSGSGDPGSGGPGSGGPGRAGTQRAAVMAGNDHRFVVITAALSTLGVPWVGIDPSRPAEVLRRQLAVLRPTVLVRDGGTAAAGALDAAAPGALRLDLGTGSVPPGVASYAEVIGYRGAARAWPAEPHLALGFTSGTTGAPKLFRRRSRSAEQRVAYLRRHAGVRPGERFLVTSPLTHASGSTWAGASLALGATVVLGDAEPAATLQRLHQHRITASFMVPAVLDGLLDAAPRQPAPPGWLRLILTGGRHLSPRTVRRARRRFGDVLHVYYATTESGMITAVGGADLAGDPGSAGLPLPGMSVRIVAPDTLADRPTGSVGLIAVAGPYTMDRYVDPAVPVAEFERDGRRYLVTGDYGRRDPAGALRVTGRDDGHPGADSVDVPGIEGALKDLPGIRDACVTRRPVDRAIRVLVGVRWCSGRRATPAEIAEAVSRLLPTGGLPPIVVTIPYVPYNSTGKVDATALSALLSRATPL
jgi:acyl-CoA synthetase (AMP-forming)/AMP-acid ligase II